MSDVLAWRTERPSVEGYYWLQESQQHVPYLVHVTFDPTGPYLYRVVYRMHQVALGLDDYRFNGARWAGPLVPPCDGD